MLPSILARQLQKGIGDYLKTSYPMANAIFKDSLQKFAGTPRAIYHEPYTAVQLPFRTSDKMPECFEGVQPEYIPYVHQAKAFDRLTGEDGRSTLIATGTGSGKTECFLYPILEYCYRHSGERGIKALIIYPMNALATDQAKRIAELIYKNPKLKNVVTAGMYVGGGNKNSSMIMTKDQVITDSDTMLSRPPDILLTNYKMLDYLLIRPKDVKLWRDNNPETLKYIAVDEIHTFDGAQGTDLACLLRRLKARLFTPTGYLCCIGTSATMGSGDSAVNMLKYASEVFGETFEENAVVTEDRLNTSEFFENAEITEFKMPEEDELQKLKLFAEEDEQKKYLEEAANAWFNDFNEDIDADETRLNLAKRLMHHSFVQSVISLMGGKFYQSSYIISELKNHYPELSAYSDPKIALDSLFALISHARTRISGKLRPFLNVHVQLWMRELRRLVAKVASDITEYSLAQDLNDEQQKHYLPVVNCRDCGATGWASISNERGNVTLSELETFYNLFFKADDRIVMMFPYEKNGERTFRPDGASEVYICPECLQVNYANTNNNCSKCGSTTIPVWLITQKIESEKNDRKYCCPFCKSKQGFMLMGLRATRGISTIMGQLFASKFNDDKKTLAFSDNVQDAAHRAGFFNSNTWRISFRTALQHYVNDGGDGLSLNDFQKGFINYWRQKMSLEDYVGFFIAPNMVWEKGYEDMLASRKFNETTYKSLLSRINKRIAYEIMLEYGVSAKIGRTLSKSNSSCLSFKKEDIHNAALKVQELCVNELGRFQNTAIEDFERMVLSFLNLMTANGAFDDKVFDSFIEKDGCNTYMLSNDYIKWLPGFARGLNSPSFPCVTNNSKFRSNYFDIITEKKYISRLKACNTELLMDDASYSFLSRYIVGILVKADIVHTKDTPNGITVYSINKNKVYITKSVVQMKCDTCGYRVSIDKEKIDLWTGSPCVRRNCQGKLELCQDSELDFNARLYASGDLARINAKEHTGLLERDNREKLETEFKLSKTDRNNWDPNVLSCTPTLEMGIDIGDLSSVILCSMPPGQAQFLQRVGRAGRKDGNALTLVVANAKAHDLYFYADPLDMLAGQVNPPKVFLKASAVLERQFVAYCLDSWVKKGIPDDAIPQKVGAILVKLNKPQKDFFPFNFINYVKNTLTSKLNSFLQMFSQYIDDSTKKEIENFARGDKENEPNMYINILHAFDSLKQQCEAIRTSIKALRKLYSQLKAKPEDSSYKEELKALKREETAFVHVLSSLRDKNLFNFLSDEGLIPNYAFPEAGIILKAVLIREDSDTSDEANEKIKKSKYEKHVYEYSRAASSAISEFAPNNKFYVDGRKLVINQVDMTTAQPERWRLCPNCSHAALEETANSLSACPSCGSTAWADFGQVRDMYKVKMVYSNMDYRKSLIGDESDERSQPFYFKQMLIDVDEEHDITSAFKLDTAEFPFGYEFVKKAVLRDINFGERDIKGEKLSISGVNEVRKGFTICTCCGKIQHDLKKPDHSYSCKVRYLPDDEKAKYTNCLFLFREFTTEVLRLLIPATTMEGSAVRTESFAAAFMLGMKEYFGNVDHLRATLTEVPLKEADCRKQYLVVYDSVPGGTGYLKQLMHNENALIEIFEKALNVMENCSCKDDEQKDGCYHCLYAYRQSHNIGNISRRAAIKMLKVILESKDKIEKIPCISNIAMNSILESELERRFIEALSRSGNEKRKVEITKALVNEKEGYLLKVNDQSWEIEPQVLLDQTNGVSVKCKPDFIIRPLLANGRRPIAVFTDGFIYHKNIVDDDSLKREAIRRGNQYRVWVLSWRDVQYVFNKLDMFSTNTLDSSLYPMGNTYTPYLRQHPEAEVINPVKMPPIELLIQYLSLPNAEEIFKLHSYAYSLSLLQMNYRTDKQAFDKWNRIWQSLEEKTGFVDDELIFGQSVFCNWEWANNSSHLKFLAANSINNLAKNKAPATAVIFNDNTEIDDESYEKEWNGFWRFFNLMQFNNNFIAVSQKGLDSSIYVSLKSKEEENNSDSITAANDAAKTERVSSNAYIESWQGILDDIFSEEARTFAKKAMDLSIIAPDEAGYELTDSKGEVLAEAEIVWLQAKICYLTQSQVEGKQIFINEGWRVLDNSSEIETDMFGGNE